jgi:hypothetical protein
MTNRDELLAAWDKLPKWVKDALYALDRRLNERLGGDPAQTVSERLARARNAGHWEGQLGCKILDRFDQGHCDRAIPAAHKDVPTTEVNMAATIIGSLIRAALLSLGTLGVSVGDDQIQQLSGAIAVIGSVAWSIYQKYQAKAAVEKAAVK